MCCFAGGIATAFVRRLCKAGWQCMRLQLGLFCILAVHAEGKYFPSSSTVKRNAPVHFVSPSSFGNHRRFLFAHPQPVQPVQSDLCFWSTWVGLTTGLQRQNPTQTLPSSPSATHPVRNFPRLHPALNLPPPHGIRVAPATKVSGSVLIRPPSMNGRPKEGQDELWLGGVGIC